MTVEAIDEYGEADAPRVVFDCMLFLQAVGKGGNHAYGCLKLAMAGKVILCMSEVCLREIDEVLRRPIIREKFPMLTDDRVDELITWLREFAEFRDSVERHFTYPTDPKDEPYLNLAIDAGAVFLVSWDRHIKRLADPLIPEGRRFMESYPQVRIRDPQTFLAEFYGEH